MRILLRRKAEKIEAQMAPMIDIVFQLLIFFMLTLKIISPEGRFEYNTPSGQPANNPLEVPQDFKVTATADGAGRLKQLKYGEDVLGTLDPTDSNYRARVRAAVDKLNARIGRVLQGRNNPEEEDIEVEINAEYELQYQYVLAIMSSVRGYFDESEDRVVPYIEKVKFVKSVPKDGGNN